MKKTVYKAALSLLMVIASQGLIQAQGVTVTASMQELSYIGKTYHGLMGSPFLYDSWNKGTVQFRDGSQQENLDLKYDQIADKLLVSLTPGQVQQFTEPVTEFTLPLLADGRVTGTRRFRSGYAPVDGASETSFYEILADGATQLVKRTDKKIVEELAPNSNILKVHQVKQSVKYYFVRSGELIPVKKDKKALVAALSDKQTGVEQYLKTNKFNLTDASLTELTNFYNKL
ncbi:MAG: hypothetical protein ACO1NZ_07695 [Adhaeribacter sp.]